MGSTDGPLTKAVHVEVCMNIRSTANRELIRNHVKELFQKAPSLLIRSGNIPFDTAEFLKQNISFIFLCERDNAQFALPNSIVPIIHVYQFNEEGPNEEVDEADVIAYQHWMLPAKEFDGVWESLLFETNVKPKLLNYCYTAMQFSDKQVNPILITWNRVVFLYGPPGTGKTSLCKALAQKLSIRLSHRFSTAQLVEINAHSLFSKWFSESGKLVQKLFGRIRELLEDETSLVCVLIDEVESLTAARRAALNGNEPSDALRVVNAVLTQIDQLRSRPNVLLLTTSNLPDACDAAFVDRADIRQFIGEPPLSARYQILAACVHELLRVGLVTGSRAKFLDFRSAELLQHTAENEATRPSLLLFQLVKRTHSLSGRFLRKLPFLAHANLCSENATPSLEEFFVSMRQCIAEHSQAEANGKAF